MASDFYLQIEGIKGESADSGHVGWIEILSGNFGVQQPKSATSSTGGGHTAERANIEDFHFHKQADLASPILLQMCAAGKTYPKATVEFMRADGAGMPIKYFEITMENVLIGSVTPSFGGGAIMCETVSLKFSRVRWKYSQQKISGGSGGNTTGGWDLSTNRIA